MKVELIQRSENEIKLLADIASICYGHEEAKNPQKLVESLDKLGHHSVFEHSFYTFYIDGISRACLAQLVRHRHTSLTVRSQRYCEEGNFKTIVPEDIKDSKELSRSFDELMSLTANFYNELRKGNVKREDARAILPMATSTKLYITLNLRQLLHMYNIRVDEAAQEEIKQLLLKMADKVIEGNGNLKPLFIKEG